MLLDFIFNPPLRTTGCVRNSKSWT